MLNLCVLEFVRNENGFFVAAQSAATACLRSYLRGRGVHSIAYTDDTLPSLNDLAEDVLSIADDGLVLIGSEENKLLVPGLPHRPDGRTAHLFALRRLGLELPSRGDGDHHRG